jgi:nucleotide-binding universal stress UspA family protein
VQPDDLIIKAEYKEFLEHTRLDELRPGMDLTVTVPGKYRFLEEQIARHYHRMEKAQKREPPLDEVVMDWYDTVYLPTAQIIQERGILRDFPDRTVTDAYVWLLQYRKDVERQLGWRINQEKSAIELIRQHSPTSERMFSRLGEKLYDALTPTELGEGPAPGTWRKEILALRRDDRLFTNILVPLSGDKESWCALAQAAEIARVEEGYLHGLHIVPSESQRESQKALAAKTEFEARCQAMGIPGNLLIEVGDIPRKICDLARWTDLIVLHLINPPGKRAISRLKSPFRPIIRRSPRPILAVPTMATTLDRALLAYDGSPKANEALFLSAYVARRPESSLTVVCVEDERVTSETLAFARGYLHRQGVQTKFVQKSGPVGETILQTAEEYRSNLIIMGGYGYSPAVELVLGSKIDEVLRRSQQPMLICR